MKDLFTVFRFELTVKVKQKSFRITTLIFMVIFFIITCIPTFYFMVSPDLSVLFSNSAESDMVTEGSPEYGYASLDNSINLPEISSIGPFSTGKIYPDEESLRTAVENDEIQKGILLKSATSFSLIAKDLGMYDTSTTTIAQALTVYNRNQSLKEHGIDPDIVDEAQAVSIDSDTITLGKNASTGFAFAYIGMFSIYMLVILYGNAVTTAVAREKNDRTMELLITNTNPTYLIWGKVLSATVVSIGQLLLLILTAVVGVLINQRNYPPFLMTAISQSINGETVAVFIVFALLGSLMYYFLYASVGALVSKVDEASSAMGPIQFLFIGGFLLSTFGMYMPDGAIMRFASIFPFTSLMSMFIRYSLTTVPVFDLILALILLIFSVLFMAYLAIRIYRMGTLNYGNRIGFFKAMKMVFSKEAAS